jgi:hypothetical protein
MSRPFQHRIKKQVEPSSGYGGWKPGVIMTHDFRDSDGDGIDDRKQPGPGVVPDWIKNRPPAPGGGKKIGVRDKSNPRRDRMEKALQDRKRGEILTGRKKRFHEVLNRKKREIGGGGSRPPMFGGGTPKPPRRGTVKGTRPRPDMPSPRPPRRGGTIGAIGGAIGGRPPMGGGKPPVRGGGRPPVRGGGRPKPPRKGTVKGSRPRPPMPSPKPPMGGGRPPMGGGRPPMFGGGIR